MLGWGGVWLRWGWGGVGVGGEEAVVPYRSGNTFGLHGMEARSRVDWHASGWKRVVQAAEFSVILSRFVSVENGHCWQHVKGFWQYNFTVSLEKNNFTAIWIATQSVTSISCDFQVVATVFCCWQEHMYCDNAWRANIMYCKNRQSINHASFSWQAFQNSKCYIPQTVFHQERFWIAWYVDVGW